MNSWRGQPFAQSAKLREIRVGIQFYMSVLDPSAAISRMAEEDFAEGFKLRRKMKIEYTILSIRSKRPSYLAWKSDGFIM